MSMNVAGIMPTKNPVNGNPMDKISKRSEELHTIQREIRYYDLCQKEKEGTLTEREAKELKSIKLARALDTIARIPDHTVCYMA